MDSTEFWFIGGFGEGFLLTVLPIFLETPSYLDSVDSLVSSWRDGVQYAGIFIQEGKVIHATCIGRLGWVIGLLEIVVMCWGGVLGLFDTAVSGVDTQDQPILQAFVVAIPWHGLIQLLAFHDHVFGQGVLLVWELFPFSGVL